MPVKLNNAEDNIKCFVCHAKPDMKERLANGKIKSYFVNPVLFQKSTHGYHTCTSCHKDIVQVPHGKGIKHHVNCSSCHYIDNLFGAPTSTKFVKKYAQFQKSVHKQALDEGNIDAPTCQDCHGSHDIISPQNPKSRINRLNIAKTCGKCHIDEYTLYKISVHGVAVGERVKEAAVCTDCHGEHNIQSIKDYSSSVYFTNIPGTCAKCHKKEKLMERYGIKTDRFETYEESYHGVATQFGMSTVANCSSCHGYHDIRAPNDPKSSVNKKNLAKTCGKCHKGANFNYAKGKIHFAAEKRDSGVVYWVALGFKVLTYGTITALCIHILLDVIRKAKTRKTGK